MGRIVGVFILVFFVSSVSAGKLEKGYQALKIHNYFKAKELFEKSYKKDTAGSGYGLSIIYLRQNNPFHQPDSAYKFILTSEKAFLQLDDKKKAKLFVLGIDLMEIQEQKEKVSHLFFKKAKKENSSIALNSFIKDHSWFKDMDEAVAFRNRVAYREATNKNTWQSLEAFFTNYPEAKQSATARHKYDRLYYEYKTQSKKIADFKSFIKDHPMSTYVGEAQDEIYARSTATESSKMYHDFIVQHPNNKNVKEAWKRVYILTVTQNDPAQIQAFLAKYPDYPNKNEMLLNVDLLNEDFFPFRNGNLWGYINDKGKEKLKPKYDWVEPFSEGLAMVGRVDFSGFIDKSGNVIVPITYDDAGNFINGFAWVQKGDFYGLVNNHGQLVLPARYDNVGEMQNDRIRVQREGKYGYYSNAISLKIAFRFDRAKPFENGFAVVTENEKKGLINRQGKYVLQPQFDWISFLNDSLLKLKIDDNYGLLNLKLDTILPFVYQFVGELSEGKIMVALDGKYGFVSKEGEHVIDLKYAYSQLVGVNNGFKNGYKEVRNSKGLFGVIDSNGKKVYPVMFEQIGSFKQTGLTAVMRYQKWGYANESVKLKINYKYQYAGDFEFGLAKVKVKDKYGIINNDGKFVVPAEYDEMDDFEQNLLRVKKDGFYGLINRNNEVVLSVKYEKIEEITETLILLQSNEKQAYYNLNDNSFVFIEAGFNLQPEAKEVTTEE